MSIWSRGYYIVPNPSTPLWKKYKWAFIKTLAPLCVQVAPRRKKSFPHDATFPQKSNIRIDCKINSPYFTIGTNLLGVSLDSRFHELVRYRYLFIKCFLLLSIKPNYGTDSYFYSIWLLCFMNLRTMMSKNTCNGWNKFAASTNNLLCLMHFKHWN